MAAAERVRGALQPRGRGGRLLGRRTGAERIVDLVASLVGKSILTMGHASAAGATGCWRRQEAAGAQRLAEAGEEVELARRHAAWYAERFSGGERRWATPQQAETFERLDVEWANIEAALGLPDPLAARC